MTAPIITLLGNATEYVANGAVYTDAGATAADNVDGVITARIVVAGDPVNTAKAGTYMVTYNVSDAAGNKAAEATRTVIVAEAIKVDRITVTPAILHKTDDFPATIEATIFPENATNKNIVWSSSEPSVVTVKDGEAELGDVIFRGVVIITATTVDGSKTANTAVCFLSIAETRAFWQFNEIYGRDEYEILDLTIEENLREMESRFFSKLFDTMTLNLPNVKGKDIFLEKYMSFRDKIKIARAAFNDLQIARAQESISGAVYSMTEETATDEATIKSTIESTIAREISTISIYDEITATVNKIDYTPAVPGDKINPAGINGTYTFTVDLANSTAATTTSNLTMTILAAPYADHS